MLVFSNLYLCLAHFTWHVNYGWGASPIPSLASVRHSLRDRYLNFTFMIYSFVELKAAVESNFEQWMWWASACNVVLTAAENGWFCSRHSWLTSQTITCMAASHVPYFTVVLVCALMSYFMHFENRAPFCCLRRHFCSLIVSLFCRGNPSWLLLWWMRRLK